MLCYTCADAHGDGDDAGDEVPAAVHVQTIILVPVQIILSMMSVETAC